MCFQKPYFVPVLTGFLCIFSVSAIFYLSVMQKLVYPLLPSLADLLPVELAGNTYRPLSIASYAFQWFLFIFSVIVSTIVYIRYKQLKFVCDYPEFKDKPMTYKIILLSLCVGLALAAFLMILPYCIHYFTCQYMGVVVWILIILYEFIDVFISVMVYQEIEIKKKIKIIVFFKAVLLLISVVMLVTSKIFWEIAIRKFAPERLGSNYTSWQPGDWGYEAHLVSAICEWIFAVVTLIYFCVLFTADFCFVHLAEPELNIECRQCH